MKRTTRMEQARQALEISERGTYHSASGRPVEIAQAVARCLNATRLFSPNELERLRAEVLANPTSRFPTVCEVVNETTLCGIARLLAESPGPVAVLNFASAKNPGGGFLNGSEAQEESLARSSALYLSLSRAWDFYENHRSSRSLLYSDAMILSPGCPLFRDDRGELLDQPQEVGFLTSAAPNAGALATYQAAERSAIPDVFRRRAELVLALAAAHGYTRLVLGAWGCGVFRNDPKIVAGAFAEHLHGLWAGRFERIVFSVFDPSQSPENFEAFRLALSPEAAPSTA